MTTKKPCSSPGTLRKKIGAFILGAAFFTLPWFTPCSSDNIRFATVVDIDGNIPSAVNVEKISYTINEVHTGALSRLELDCFLLRSQDEVTLKSLSDMMYMDNRGANYNQVMIKWQLNQDEPSGTARPWAISFLTKNISLFSFPNVQ